MNVTEPFEDSSSSSTIVALQFSFARSILSIFLVNFVIAFLYHVKAAGWIINNVGGFWKVFKISFILN